ncbi:hypothetical protein PRIPAC_83212 [Pristionchus pacificus]|uniref:Uncharacterized protein n=1 Tax=Pristionchus pacificus TaxID=54126 RepID=A0A2A6BUF4_PRIPA|nr:hypothetical protein PRIPAC_83212 [Pristionchus pacificus]|eukprot:PDM69544.1 hypothetical protein PRIPAC_44640 [Pristionchus pacificus]
MLILNIAACGDRLMDGHRQRRHRRVETIGGRYADRGLSEPPSDRLLLPSLDRSWEYGSRSYSAPSLVGLPQGPPPSSFLMVRPKRGTMSCERPSRPDSVPSSTVPALHCECGCQRLDTWSRAWTGWRATTRRLESRRDCPPHLRLFRSVQEGPPPISAPLPSSSRLITRGSIPVLSPSFHLLDEPDQAFAKSAANSSSSGEEE